MPKFLKSSRVRVLTVLLLCQAAILYGFSRKEVAPAMRPLVEFPKTFQGWTMSQEGVMEKEVLDILKADDVLTRTYTDASYPLPVSLFIASFKSQRTGQSPHSPKNCLPGSGWVASVSDIIRIQVPGRTEPVEVNRYVVQKGEYASVVLYWYQSRDRTVASEYKAKYYVVSDALRHNRTDTALVRVICPIASKNVPQAQKIAEQFVKDSFSTVRSFMPS